MGKGMLRAALACLALVGAVSVARADTVSTLVKADTLFMNSADSSAVIDVSNAARLWLDFIIPPGPACAGCVDAGADTLVKLFVEVREVLNASSGTDDSSVLGNQRIAATVSDTTIIRWNPRFNLTGTTTADSVVVNPTTPTIDTPSSSEFVVYIPPVTTKYGSNSRSARVDLINVNTGAPFRSQFAQFKWRLVKGNAAIANNPAAIKLRVVLGMETF